VRINDSKMGSDGCRNLSQSSHGLTDLADGKTAGFSCWEALTVLYHALIQLLRQRVLGRILEEDLVAGETTAG
jgi:hypothetical protein